MLTSWTSVFITQPWLAPAVWVVLHSSDFYLTLWGAKLYHTGANRVLSFAGSYELNPLYQTVIDQRKWFPKRFIFPLFLMVLGLYTWTWLVGSLAGQTTILEWMPPLVFGSLFFVRVGLIGIHLQNIWLFRRILQPNSPITGSIRYDRRSTYFMAASRLASWAVLLGLAALFSPSPWTWGGCLGCALIALKLYVLGARHRDEPVANLGGDADRGLEEQRVHCVQPES
jgi:hypothetical protein